MIRSAHPPCTTTLPQYVRSTKAIHYFYAGRAGIRRRHHAGPRNQGLDRNHRSAAVARLCAGRDQPARHHRAHPGSAGPFRHGRHHDHPDACRHHRYHRHANHRLLVDAVSDIISVEPGTVRPVPQMDLPTEESFLEGLVALDDRMVTLVSLDGLIGPVDPRGTSLRSH